jgi:hypothetical protein
MQYSPKYIILVKSGAISINDADKILMGTIVLSIIGYCMYILLYILNNIIFITEPIKRADTTMINRKLFNI